VAHYPSDHEEYEIAMGNRTRADVIKEHVAEYARDPAGHVERYTPDCTSQLWDYAPGGPVAKGELEFLAKLQAAGVKKDVVAFEKASADFADWKDQHDGGRFATQIPGFVLSPMSPPGTIHYLSAYWANGKRIYISSKGNERFKSPEGVWSWVPDDFYPDSRGTGRRDTVMPYKSDWEKAQGIILLLLEEVVAFVAGFQAGGIFGAWAGMLGVVNNEAKREEKETKDQIGQTVKDAFGGNTGGSGLSGSDVGKGGPGAQLGDDWRAFAAWLRLKFGG
jgi:hypothetical protein